MFSKIITVLIVLIVGCILYFYAWLPLTAAVHMPFLLILLVQILVVIWLCWWILWLFDIVGRRPY